MRKRGEIFVHLEIFWFEHLGRSSFSHPQNCFALLRLSVQRRNCQAQMTVNGAARKSIGKNIGRNITCSNENMLSFLWQVFANCMVSNRSIQSLIFSTLTPLPGLKILTPAPKQG